MSRLIDADELIKKGYVLTRNFQQDEKTRVIEYKKIEDVPTVPLDWKSILDDWTEHDNAMIAKGREIERRLNATKHGRWKVISEYPKKAECSYCGYPIEHELVCWWDYCPNCGAKMDGGEDESY